MSEEEERPGPQDYGHAILWLVRLTVRLVTGQIELKSPKAGDPCDVLEIHADAKFAEETCRITGSLAALREHEREARTGEASAGTPAVTVDHEGLEERWEIYVDQPPSPRWGRFELKIRMRGGRRRRTRVRTRGWRIAQGAPA